MHGIVNVEPEMGIGMPLGLGEAEIKYPFSLTDGFIAKLQHYSAWFRTTADELGDGDVQIKSIQNYEIRLAQVLDIAWRRLKGVRAHTFWHEAMHLQSLTSYLLDHIC